MNLDRDSRTQQSMRLDDIFRLLLHDRTVDTLRVLLPDLSLSANVVSPVRLDTQSPLTRLLVDAAYLVRDERRQHLLLFEGQSRAGQWSEERPAELLHASIAQLPAEPLLTGIRLVEIRLRQRAIRRTPVVRTGSPSFAPINVLLEVDPDLQPFCEPEYWVFAAFSRRVDARWIAAKALEHRAIALADPGRGLLPSDRLLLGLCGRARFPDSIECRNTLEELMNEAAKAARLPSPASNLTAEERHHLEVSILAEGQEAARLRREREEAHLITGRAELEQGRAALQTGREQLALEREQLALEREHLAVQREQLALGQEHLAVQQEQVRTQQEHLAAQQEQVRMQQEQLAAQQEQLAAQQEQLAAQQEQVRMQQEQVRMQQEQVQQEREEFRRRLEALERLEQALHTQKAELDEHRRTLDTRMKALESDTDPSRND